MSDGIFSREARNPIYAKLRQLMYQSRGAISIEDCIRECDRVGLKVERGQIAAARNQYKRMASSAKEIAKPVPPLPEEEVKFVEEIESMSEDYSSDAVEAEEEIKESVSGKWWEGHIPQVDSTFHLNKQLSVLFNTVEKLSKQHLLENKPSQRIRLVGPSGCGKTAAAIQYAAKTKRPVFVIDCPTLREAMDLFGTRNVEKGETVFTESLFAKAVELDRAVIIFDEANRMHPSVGNILFPLLDFRGAMHIDLMKRKVKVGNGVTFFATLNEGSEFTGTEAMDEAIKNRFSSIIECTYLDPVEEAKLLVSRYKIDLAKAQALAEIAKVNRDKHKAGQVYTRAISTRVLENAAEMLIGGDETLYFTIACHFEENGTHTSERKAILDLLKGKGFKV